MINIKSTFGELRSFLVLLITQSLSSLGSSATNFALIIWSYTQTNSALSTALLSVCTYVPYVISSIFAGAICDKFDKKKLMLGFDCFSAICSVTILFLYKADRLEIWHLYVINALGGLANTFQQPASDVAISLLVQQQHYQKTSGFRSLMNSLINIMTPVIATALLALSDLSAVIAFDLITFAIAFISLALFIKIPNTPGKADNNEGYYEMAKSGIRYLKNNRGILNLIFYLAAINFTASMFNAVLPALIIPKSGETALGVINTITGIAMLAGSALASLLPAPKSRVRVINNALLFSMSTENFILALGGSLPVWCIGAVCGWIAIPMMNANMDTLLRMKIPASMQGRVYSARNTLQFFTIPIGYFLGGILVDRVFEPFMALKPKFLYEIFGSGKGSGAALLFALLGIIGTLTCLIFRRDNNIRQLETDGQEI